MGGCACSGEKTSKGPDLAFPGSGESPDSTGADSCGCGSASAESPLPDSSSSGPSSFSIAPSSSVAVPAGATPGAKPSSFDVAAKSKRVLVATSVTLTASAVAVLAAVKMASNAVKITAVLTYYSVVAQITVVLQGTNDFENFTTLASFNTSALGQQDFTPPATGVSVKAVRLVLIGPNSGVVIIDDICFWIPTL